MKDIRFYGYKPLRIGANALHYLNVKTTRRVTSNGLVGRQKPSLARKDQVEPSTQPHTGPRQCLLNDGVGANGILAADLGIIIRHVSILQDIRAHRLVRVICPSQSGVLDRLRRAHVVPVDPRAHTVLVFSLVDRSSELACEPKGVFKGDVRVWREAEDRVGDRGIPYGVQVRVEAVKGDSDGIPPEIYARRVQRLRDITDEL